MRRWTQEGALPLPLPGLAYGEREAEVGSPSKAVLTGPSKGVIRRRERPPLLRLAQVAIEEADKRQGELVIGRVEHREIPDPDQT